MVATRDLRANGFLSQDDEVVIFSTGSRMKHTDLIATDLPVIDPHDPVAAIAAARRRP